MLHACSAFIKHGKKLCSALFSHKINLFMRRLDDFTPQKNGQIGIEYLIRERLIWYIYQKSINGFLIKRCTSTQHYPTVLTSSSHFADDATQSSADEMSCSYDDQTGLDADKHRKHCGNSSDVTGTVNAFGKARHNLRIKSSLGCR